MLDNSAQILTLEPSKKLSPGERTTRILKARDLAKKRFEECNAKVTGMSGLPSPLQTLGTRWTSKEAAVNRSTLMNDSKEQDTVMKLVYDTEVQTSQICGAPTETMPCFCCSPSRRKRSSRDRNGKATCKRRDRTGN